MKFEWFSYRSGQEGIQATPGEYDGTPPIDSLLVDQVTDKPIHDGRFAAAAVLAFGGYISGVVETPDRPVSVGLSEEIGDFLAPFVRHVVPVHFHQKKTPTGYSTLAVARDYDDLEKLKEGFTERTVNLIVRRSDTFAGSIYNKTALEVSSNAFLIRALAQAQGVQCCYPELAVAVLLADDLGCNKILVSEELGNKSAQGILREVNLALLVKGC